MSSVEVPAGRRPRLSWTSATLALTLIPINVGVWLVAIRSQRHIETWFLRSPCWPRCS